MPERRTQFWSRITAGCPEVRPFVPTRYPEVTEYVIQVWSELELRLLSYGNLFYLKIFRSEDFKGVWPNNTPQPHPRPPKKRTKKTKAKTIYIIHYFIKTGSLFHLMMIMMMLNCFCAFFMPYFQRGPLSEKLTIANLRHGASRVSTCAESAFRLRWMKLCINDNHYTAVPHLSKDDAAVKWKLKLEVLARSQVSNTRLPLFFKSH